MFEKLRYQESVQEGTTSDKFVLKVAAFDIDTTQDEITYSLGKEGQRYFTIGSRTGEIKTGGRPLDRETTPVLNFTVFASDGKNVGIAGVKVKYRQFALFERCTPGSVPGLTSQTDFCKVACKLLCDV